MAQRMNNIFISHIHEDDEGLGKLKNLLENNGRTVRDFSISSDNPNNAQSEDYIKSEILGPRIQLSGVLLVYVSKDTKGSEYVDWEIEYAHKKDKRIVGVWAYGERECEVPEALEKYANSVVGWQGNRIIEAIDGEINNWEMPDGSTRDRHEIDRYDCGKESEQ